MKSKGAVKFFAIALAIVCLFQLSFTFIADYHEKKAERYAKGNEQLKRKYLDSLKHETILNIGVHKYNYNDVKERELNLGLDLRGGMHVTMEVAVDKLLKQLSNTPEQPVEEFDQALAEAKKEKVTSQRNFVDIFTEKLQQKKPNAQLITYFYNLESQKELNRTASNPEVVTYLKQETSNALQRTFQILRTRIDQFGVTQPNVQMDEASGRILVELPGADDPERVRNLLKKSAKLEFYETFVVAEIRQFLLDADKALKAHNLGSRIRSNDPAAIAQSKKDSANKIKADSIDRLVKATPQQDTVRIKTLLTEKQKFEPQTGSPDDNPLLYLLGAEQIRMDGPIVGYVRVVDTAKVNDIITMPQIAGIFPSEMRFAWGAKAAPGTDRLELYLLRGRQPVLTGDKVINATSDVDRQTNEFMVSMQMNTEGATEWATITRDAAAKNPKGHIAIVLDNQVYSAPQVRNEIPNGNSQITGNFTANDAKDLANILKAGKLPVELEVVDQAVVGPSLGQDAINSGLLSLLISVIAIVVFMVVYYNRGGWVANLAVLVNLFFIIGVLSSLQAALTLPGMAGIVLTLAMAVDANVLIYERIREELGLGKPMRVAIADGFKHALSSILDGNITTLLIGIILMAFGSGPIYGFAVVLVIGILTSLFTAILISRLIFEWLLAKDKKLTFGNSLTNNLLQGISFDFVGKRKIGYWFSGITFALAVASLAFRGLNYGVEFKGGYSYTVNFKNTPQIEDVRSSLSKTFGKNPEVKEFGNPNTLAITTDYLVDENSDQTDAKVRGKLQEGLNTLNNPYEILQTNKVGSTIASDIKNSALWSIVLGLLVIFGYIVIRFKRWQFAMGATLALAHDAIFILGLFSIFKDVLPFMDVDQAIVAAVLTVIGYSVNDTVVVFDRIREYLRGNRKQNMKDTVNDAINHTLSRTIITSITVVIVALILFIFGGPVIRGFSFAMLIGVMLGTYSSIFVATPIALDLHKKEELESPTAL